MLCQRPQHMQADQRDQQEPSKIAGPPRFRYGRTTRWLRSAATQTSADTAPGVSRYPPRERLQNCPQREPRVKPNVRSRAASTNTRWPTQILRRFHPAGAGSALGMVSAGAVSTGAGGTVPDLPPFAASSISQLKIIPTPKIVTSAIPISGPRCHLFCFSAFLLFCFSAFRCSSEGLT